ncbi:hypothetical protein Tco_0291124 [Tanacetum coccineum]
MEYLVKDSKKARILELKRRYFEDYCSDTIRRIHQGRYDVSVRALTKDEDHKIQYAVSRKGNTPYSSYMGIKYSRRYQTWSLLQETPNTPYPTPWIRHYYFEDQYAVSIKEDTAYPCLHSPKTTEDKAQYAVSKETQYAVFKIWNKYNILEDIKRGSYSKKSTIRLRMTKVIKGEFEKIKDVKVKDVPLTCDTPLEVFNNEVSRLSGMDDDLFTYEVEVANIPCDSKMDDDSEQEADDDMGYDPSDVAFIEWLGSKNFNYKTMDHYTMKALWIYWIRGDDEVELTDEESSDDEDDVAEVFRIDTNIFDYETPLCSAFKELNYLLEVDPDLLTKDIIGFKMYEDYKNDWIYEWNKDVPWVDEKPYANTEVWTKPTPVKHTCKPFNYKTRIMNDTKLWKIVNLKMRALRNKAIMEGFIKKNDDESLHELPVCNIRRYMMIKYSFNDDEEYVAVKEDKYDDLTVTRKEACRAYQEIFQIMDEGWMVT